MKRSPFVMLSFLLLAAPSMAAASEFGIGFFGGFNTYAMNLNDRTSVTPIYEINSGAGFGGGLRISMSTSLLLSLDYERLTGSTSSSGATNGVSYHATLDMPANAIVAGATYYFPSTSKARFGITGGLGYYKADGSGTITLDDGVNDITLSGDVTGTGVGLHGGAAVDVGISPLAHVEAMAGYRMAKTGDLEDNNGTTFHGSAGWSGLMSRVGFSIFPGHH